MPQLNVKQRGLWITNHRIDVNKLYAVLCCIAYWLEALGRGAEFKRSLNRLFQEYPSVDTAAMGFPPGWENEPLWAGDK